MPPLFRSALRDFETVTLGRDLIMGFCSRERQHNEFLFSDRVHRDAGRALCGVRVDMTNKVRSSHTVPSTGDQVMS
eukprot:470190-Amorphochlora_amoeboformis.AAC.1